MSPDLVAGGRHAPHQGGLGRGSSEFCKRESLSTTRRLSEGKAGPPGVSLNCEHVAVHVSARVACLHDTSAHLLFPMGRRCSWRRSCCSGRRWPRMGRIRLLTSALTSPRQTSFSPRSVRPSRPHRAALLFHVPEILGLGCPCS
jgi:hypothetical protein